MATFHWLDLNTPLSLFHTDYPHRSNAPPSLSQLHFCDAFGCSLFTNVFRSIDTSPLWKTLAPKTSNSGFLALLLRGPTELAEAPLGRGRREASITCTDTLNLCRLRAMETFVQVKVVPPPSAPSNKLGKRKERSREAHAVLVATVTGRSA